MGKALFKNFSVYFHKGEDRFEVIDLEEMETTEDGEEVPKTEKRLKPYKLRFDLFSDLQKKNAKSGEQIVY